MISSRTEKADGRGNVAAVAVHDKAKGQDYRNRLNLLRVYGSPDQEDRQGDPGYEK